MRTRTAAAVPLVFVLVLYFLASAASAVSTVIRMYLRFRDCPVALDIELYVSAWYHKTRLALYCCVQGVF